MILYWIHNIVIQGHYLVYWARYKGNGDNYFTKHNPTKHQHLIRSIDLFPAANTSKQYCYMVPSDLQVFLNTSPPRKTDKGWTVSPTPTNG